MVKVTIPHNWSPRSYQLPVWEYLENGGKRAVAAWHRRAGKDDVALHWAAVSAFQKVGGYWHMLPEASQARKAIWNAVNPHTGIRRIDEAFPHELRETTLNNEMFIRFKNGSTWQVIGSDNFHSLVGAPPIGIVFSEWARANPSAWAYLRPILVENGGWAFFISTFFGRNHHYEMERRAEEWEDWFGEKLSAKQTDVFTPEQLEQERLEYLAEYGEHEGDALFRQEYLSDPMASVQGSYFGAEMSKAEEEERLTIVPYERKSLVWTAWDLGLDDETAIWFCQVVGREIRIIDYLAARNEDLAWYAAQLAGRGYAYGGHILPHDGAAKTILSKDNAKTQLQAAGLQNIHIAERALNAQAKIAQINEGRALITKCVFDKKKCDKGIDALRNYRREWNDTLKTYSQNPVHDWASHGADAWRTLACNMNKVAPVKMQRRERKRARSAWAA